MSASPAVALLDTSPLWQDVVVVGSGRVVQQVAKAASYSPQSRRVIAGSIRDARRLAEPLTAPLFCVSASRHLWRDIESIDGPVLVIGARCHAPAATTGELVVCLDGSRRAEGVLPVATAWAAALGLRLTLVTVAGPAPITDAAHVMYHDVLEGNYLARTAARLAPTGTELTWEVLHGRRESAVAAYAAGDRAAMIAVNTHGESTGPGAACGRLPARLVAASPVPVLVTRWRRQEPSPATPAAPSRTTPRFGRGPGLAGPVADPTRLEAAARAYRVRALPAEPTPPPRNHSISRGSVVAIALAVSFTVSVALVTLPAPYYSRVGASLVAADMISVERPVEHERTILVTFVKNERLTHLDAFRGWLDPDRDVEPLRGAGRNNRAGAVNQQLMSDAASTARTVVARLLGPVSQPLDATVDTHGLGGPSAGLAFALEMLDQLTPGSLTGGRMVAATGALDGEGKVLAVAGIGYKARAAAQAGADVLLVPTANADEARRSAPGMRVVAVATFPDALGVVTAL